MLSFNTELSRYASFLPSTAAFIALFYIGVLGENCPNLVILWLPVRTPGWSQRSSSGRVTGNYLLCCYGAQWELGTCCLSLFISKWCLKICLI